MPRLFFPSVLALACAACLTPPPDRHDARDACVSDIPDGALLVERDSRLRVRGATHVHVRHRGGETIVPGGEIDLARFDAPESLAMPGLVLRLSQAPVATVLVQPLGRSDLLLTIPDPPPDLHLRCRPDDAAVVPRLRIDVIDPRGHVRRSVGAWPGGDGPFTLRTRDRELVTFAGPPRLAVRSAGPASAGRVRLEARLLAERGPAQLVVENRVIDIGRDPVVFDAPSPAAVRLVAEPVRLDVAPAPRGVPRLPARIDFPDGSSASLVARLPPPREERVVRLRCERATCGRLHDVTIAAVEAEVARLEPDAADVTLFGRDVVAPCGVKTAVGVLRVARWTSDARLELRWSRASVLLDAGVAAPRAADPVESPLADPSFRLRTAPGGRATPPGADLTAEWAVVAAPKPEVHR